jgi:1-acyl-sn-glycerol-3-phosphate acyltransferase
VVGYDAVPAEPLVVYAKHQSTWETLFLRRTIPNAVFVAKRELVWIPFFGWALGSLRFILIDRSAGKKAIRQIIDQFKDRKQRGLSLIIFPEGTRTLPHAKPAYKIGGTLVACETNTRLLPVAHNAGLFWPRHSFLKWPGMITVEFGPAMDATDTSPEALRDDAMQWIESRMAVLLQQG